jgi:hypothetical protein
MKFPGDKEELGKMIASLRAVCFGEEQKESSFIFENLGRRRRKNVRGADCIRRQKEKDDAKSDEKGAKPDGAQQTIKRAKIR